jgi:hypothetical protein
LAWFSGGVLVCLAAIALGCGGSNEQQQGVVQGGNAYATPGGQQPGPYGQTPTTGYQQQPQQGGYNGAPQPYGPQQAAPQPSATQAPSPLAPACQSDFICGTHRCNLQTGRCSFPCASNQDCQPGFSCIGAGGPTAICAPGGGT